jgi:hypothetical protein
MKRPSYKALEESFNELRTEHNNTWLLLTDIVQGRDQSVTFGSGAAKVKVHYTRLTGAMCGLVAIWINQMVWIRTLDAWRALAEGAIPHGTKEYALDDAILANQQKALAHILAARERAWAEMNPFNRNGKGQNHA